MDFKLTALKEGWQAVRDVLTQQGVVVVSGPPGCGKSTLLPRLALEAGWGPLAHTQPRRLAVVRLAQRLQATLPENWRHQVGWRTRFDRYQPELASIEVMTEGVLLQRLNHDPELKAFQGVILDEVHERSLPMDLLLGWCRQLQKRRPDFKLMLTSATLEAERLGAWLGAPCLTVGAPLHSVTTLHYESEGCPEGVWKNLEAAIQTLDEQAPGDILIFLTGEAEVMEAVQKLALIFPHKEVVPLFARCTGAQTEPLFRPSLRSRIICATNVAESSLTLPTVAHVIDLGLAKVARTAPRSRRKLLQVEKIAQASAVQRAGRCGRTQPGFCIRLYSEADLQARPVYSDPEMARMPLDALLLQLVALSPEPPVSFPFFDAPDAKKLQVAAQNLERLGALQSLGEGRFRLTPLGWQMLRCPLEPVWAWVLIHSEKLGLLTEMQIILAGLECEPWAFVSLEERKEIQKRRARWGGYGSDLLRLLGLWHSLEVWRARLTRAQFEQECRRHGLAPERLRQWRRAVQQFQSLMGLELIRPPRPMEKSSTWAPQLHGLLVQAFEENLARWDPLRRCYIQRNGAPIWPHPSSSLWNQKSEWIWSAECWTTRKTWAFGVVGLSQAAVVQSCAHRIETRFGEPYWDAEQVQACVQKRTLLFGWTLSQVEGFPYGQVEPSEARQRFIEEACIQSEVAAEKLERPYWTWLRSNRTLQEAMLKLEVKSRTSGWAWSEREQEAFYVARLPQEVFSEATLEKAFASKAFCVEELEWRGASPFQERLQAAVALEAVFPDRWLSEGWEARLFYVDQPQSGEMDGVCAALPLGQAFSATELQELSWHLPGHRLALVEALLAQALPQLSPSLRRQEAQLFLEKHTPPPKARLDHSLAGWLRDRHQLNHFAEDWNWGALPPHLKMKVGYWEEDGRLSTSPPPRFWKALWPESVVTSAAQSIAVISERQRWEAWLQASTLPGWAQAGLWREAMLPPKLLQFESKESACALASVYTTVWLPTRSALLALGGGLQNLLMAFKPLEDSLKREDWLQNCCDRWLASVWPQFWPRILAEQGKLRPSWPLKLQEAWRAWLERLRLLRVEHEACMNLWQRLQNQNRGMSKDFQDSWELLESFWIERWGQARAYLPGLSQAHSAPRAVFHLRALQRRMRCWAQNEGGLVPVEAHWRQSLQAGGLLYSKAVESLASAQADSALRRLTALQDWYWSWDELHLLLFDQKWALKPAPSWQRLQRFWQVWMDNKGGKGAPCAPVPSEPLPSKLSATQRLKLQERWGGKAPDRKGAE